MLNHNRLIFIHGLEGTSQGVKASLLRSLFPGIFTPDFRGTLDERMVLLEEILGMEKNWIIIGSSFGGLMGAIYACQRPQQVNKLILLAPALIWPDFKSDLPAAIELPVILYHGNRDAIVPIDPVRQLAEQIFLNLDFREVDDDHGLYKTVHAIDWFLLLNTPAS